MGNNIGYLFQRSFRVLNTLLWPIVLLSVLTSPILFLNSLNPWAIYLAWFDLILRAILTIALIGFIYGFLIDLSVEQEISLSFELFLKNLLAFFKVSFLIFLLAVITHFIVFLLHGPSISFETIQTAIFPLTTLIWLNVVFKSKFKDRVGSILLDPTLGKLLFIGALVYYSLFFLHSLLQAQFVSVSRLGAFILWYLALFTFLVMAHQIIERFSLRCLPTVKEIYLVNPLRWTLSALFLSFIRVSPFVFIILRALTPQEYRFKEFNQLFWRRKYYTGGKLVAITCFTNNCLEAYKIAKEFRKAGSTVVMGGPHVTAFPEEALGFCDAVVVGPVEGVWARIIKDHETGALRGIYSAPAPQETLETVQRFLLAQPPAVIANCLETTRGCKFNCYFCGGGHARTGLHQMPLENVLSLLSKAKQHSKTLAFLDDNIYCDPVYSKELFRSMKSLNIRWSGSSSLDIAKDPEALSLCKESGCQTLLIGYEIFPGSKEHRTTSKFSLADDYIHLTRIIRKKGIGIKAHFIYGFEKDGFISFWRLWWFALRLYPEISSLCILTPVPNSRFYKNIEDQDRFMNLNWSRYDLYNLVFRHAKINNALFHNSSMFIITFFVLTTSRSLLIILISLTIVLLRLL